MFYGEYLHRVDEKGRTIIPQKFRDELGSSFMLTKGYDNSLFIFPMDEWNKLVSKIEEKPFSGEAMRKFSRKFFSGATECEVDKQGRLLIPLGLREHSKISSEVYIIGVSSRAEIWDKQAWIDYNSDENGKIDSMAKEMAELGI
ncbi:MAG: division/cell wall cluster transcriptional repressor MraZ [Clostridia bacterium]|nr:division/cell wall cluster transcriptional repressor MraZ [Clostridia bacterium]